MTGLLYARSVKYKNQVPTQIYKESNNKTCREQRLTLSSRRDDVVMTS